MAAICDQYERFFETNMVSVPRDEDHVKLKMKVHSQKHDLNITTKLKQQQRFAVDDGAKVHVWLIRLLKESVSC